jgi:Ca2+/Na+ antiporter
MNTFYKWLIATACIALFLLIIYKMDGCSQKKVEKTVTQVEQSNFKQNFIDSIKSEAVKDTVELLEKKVQNRDVTIKAQSKKIISLQSKYNVALNDYVDDTVRTNPCDSLASTSKRLINAQSNKIDSLNATKLDLQQETKSLITLIGNKNKTISNQNNDIITLTKISKRTWWEKNEKYFAFGFGALIGSSGIYILSR